MAIWDPNTHRYYFENTQTRQTQWNYPGAAPPPPSGNYNETVVVEEKDKQKSGPGYGKIALGVAGGLAGGALLDHEAHKVSKYKRDTSST